MGLSFLLRPHKQTFVSRRAHSHRCPRSTEVLLRRRKSTQPGRIYRRRQPAQRRCHRLAIRLARRQSVGPRHALNPASRVHPITEKLDKGKERYTVSVHFLHTSNTPVATSHTTSTKFAGNRPWRVETLPVHLFKQSLAPYWAQKRPHVPIIGAVALLDNDNDLSLAERQVALLVPMPEFR